GSRRQDRLVEPRAPRAVRVRSLPWRPRLRGAGLRAARRAGARRARAPDRVRVRARLPVVRRSADPDPRAAAGSRPRQRARDSGQGRSTRIARLLAPPGLSAMGFGDALKERLGELTRARRGGGASLVREAHVPFGADPASRTSAATATRAQPEA